MGLTEKRWLVEFGPEDIVCGPLNRQALRTSRIGVKSWLSHLLLNDPICLNFPICKGGFMVINRNDAHKTHSMMPAT